MNRAANLLREIFKKYQFEDFRILNKYYWAYKFGRGKAFSLVKVDFELTFLCNCKCVMCPLYGIHTAEGKDVLDDRCRHKELTTSQIAEVIDDIKLLGAEGISLTGGEPLLRKDIFDIIKYSKKKRLTVSIFTNGFLLDRGMAKKLVELEVDVVMFSLDASKEVHNQIRRTSVFEKAMNAVDYLKEEKNKHDSRVPEISLNCTISKKNQSSLCELIKIAHKKDVPIRFSSLFYTTEAMESKTNEIYKMGDIKKEDQKIPDEIKNVDVDILYTEIQKLKKQASQLNQEYSIDIHTKEDIENRFYDDKHSDVKRCFYPWFNTRIDPYGNVYPCSMNVLMGNVNKQRFSQIWNNEKYREFRKNLKKNGIFPKCTKCCVITNQNRSWNLLS